MCSQIRASPAATTSPPMRRRYAIERACFPCSPTARSAYGSSPKPTAASPPSFFPTNTKELAMNANPPRRTTRRLNGISVARRSTPLLAPLLSLLGRLQATAESEAQANSISAARDAVVQHALSFVHARLKVASDLLSSPNEVRNYLRLRLAAAECEVFFALFMDAQNRLLAAEELFRGTLSQTSVYPREVVKAALKHNAAAIIFAHNHPSGVAEPSRADELLTVALKQALALVDIRTIDHFVVAGAVAVSFAERGLL